MLRASVLLVGLALAGCAGPADGTSSVAGLDDVPSFAEPRAEAPDWVWNQASAFWSDFGSVDAARGAPFARAALELELPGADCDEAPCRLRGHSYVRFELAGDTISLMPHCSVVAEDPELLHRAGGYGPWRLASGAPARLPPVPHDALPAPLPSRVATHPNGDAPAPRRPNQVATPVWGNRGDPPVTPARHPSPNQISIPAGAPHFGRRGTQSSTSVASAPGSVQGPVNSGSPGSGESREAGFWPPGGQIATAGARRPAFQTRSGQFQPLRRPSISETRDPIAVGEDEVDERGSGQADARAGELDFPNRFRVEYVRGRLTGREVGVAELRIWVPGPAPDADDETRLEIEAADAACVEGLTGPMSLRSAG